MHPITGWLFCRMDNIKVTCDGSDCDLDYDEIPPNRDMDPGAIVAMHPKAPLMGGDPEYYEGTFDWVVYHDKADYDLTLKYQYPMVSSSIQYFCWDETG